MNEKDFNLKNNDLVILREGRISESVLLENDFKIIHKNVIVIGLKEQYFQIQYFTKITLNVILN